MTNQTYETDFQAPLSVCSFRKESSLLTSIQVTLLNLELKFIFVWDIFPCCKKNLTLYKGMEEKRKG